MIRGIKNYQRIAQHSINVLFAGVRRKKGWMHFTRNTEANSSIDLIYVHKENWAMDRKGELDLILFERCFYIPRDRGNRCLLEQTEKQIIQVNWLYVKFLGLHRTGLRITTIELDLILFERFCGGLSDVFFRRKDNGDAWIFQQTEKQILASSVCTFKTDLRLYIFLYN